MVGIEEGEKPLQIIFKDELAVQDHKIGSHPAKFSNRIKVVTNNLIHEA
jgi:hypothetical protein